MKLEVYNCGQGDASVIYYPQEKPLVIDLGPKSFKYPYPFSYQDIDLLITHSHIDHIEGWFSNSVTINNLYVPAYFFEIQKILKVLLNPKKQAVQFSCKKIILLYEGFKIDFNCSILNPPLNPDQIFKMSKIDINEDEIDAFLKKYNTSIRQIVDERIFISEDIDDHSIEKPKGYSAEKFVILAMKHIIKRYRSGSVKLEKAISRFLEYDANKISIVSIHKSPQGGSVLMTGDADKSVFNRLIKKGVSIKATILKVPHHGSKYSIDHSILQKISPEIAIISHNNGIFGRAKDSHPNIVVIENLKKLKIPIYCTNEVVKNGESKINASSGIIYTKKFVKVEIIS